MHGPAALHAHVQQVLCCFNALWERGKLRLAAHMYPEHGCLSEQHATVQAGLDYSKLKGVLAEGEFQAADDETRDLLIRLAGPEAVKRKWVYFTEVCPHWLMRCVLSSCAVCY